MIKKPYRAIFLLLISLSVSACRLQNAQEYSRDFIRIYSGSLLPSLLRDIFTSSAYYCLILIPAGVLLFLLSLILFLFNRNEKSLPLLGVSALMVSALYAAPYLTLLKSLPNQEILILQIRTVLLLSYYFALRSWNFILFRHRKKPWLQYTRAGLIALAYLTALLGWYRPGILSSPWIVPLIAVFTLTDASLCSILSLQRKNDRSGLGGLFLTASILGGAAWFLITSESRPGFFLHLDNLFFLIPALILPVQLILALIMMQAGNSKKQKNINILKSLADEQKASLEKNSREMDALAEEKQESLRIPAFNLKAAQAALQTDPIKPLKVPEGWEGSHFMSSSSSALPALGAWAFSQREDKDSDSLLLAESRPEDRYAVLSLHMIRQITENLVRKGTSPAAILWQLNRELVRLGETPEHAISGMYLHLMEEEALCATAGTTLIWYKKPGSRMVAVASDTAPCTLHQGLGFRPYSRETGKPYRIKMEKGDILVIASRSLIYREQELNGERYGKNSLIRVMDNHDTSPANKILSALIKDFDDFDMGNTRDRQIYAAVFRKV